MPNIERLPEEIVSGFQNNLAYVLDQAHVRQYPCYAATFG